MLTKPNKKGKKFKYSMADFVRNKRIKYEHISCNKRYPRFKIHFKIEGSWDNKLTKKLLSLTYNTILSFKQNNLLKRFE